MDARVNPRIKSGDAHDEFVKQLKLARMGVTPAGDGEWSEFNLIGICSNRRQGWQVAILFPTTLVRDAPLAVSSPERSVARARI
jgi:hypothetical protein